MKFSDHIQVFVTRGRIVSGALLLACASLPATSSARQAASTAPAAPQAPVANAPATTPAARPAQATPPRRPPVNVTPRVPQTAPAPALAPTAQPAPVQATTPRPAVAPVPPREVVTVVHRLSGWKLLAWLATSGPPALELDELPSMKDSHTNIVAGYIYEDGRTVVARLSQAEVDLESFSLPPTPPGFFAPTAGAPVPEPEYLLVTAEGKRVEAKFVGIDASTGLTMLEAKEPSALQRAHGCRGRHRRPDRRAARAALRALRRRALRQRRRRRKAIPDTSTSASTRRKVC